MSDIRQRLADLVSGELETRDWSERELSRRADLSNETINRIVRGDGNPRLSSLEALEDTLDLDLGNLSE